MTDEKKPPQGVVEPSARIVIDMHANGLSYLSTQWMGKFDSSVVGMTEDGLLQKALPQALAELRMQITQGRRVSLDESSQILESIKSRHQRPPQEAVTPIGNTGPQHPWNAAFHASMARCASEDLAEARKTFGDKSPQYKTRLLQYMPMIESNIEPILSAAVSELDNRAHALRSPATQTG